VEVPTVLDARVVTESGGGPEKTILNSPRYLSRWGYRMLCGYMHPPGDPGFERLREKARRSQAPLLSIPDSGPWDWSVIGDFLRICRRERVRIWHGHDYKSNAIGLLLRRFWPMHLVTTAHGWVKITRRTPLYHKVDRLCLPRYDLVLCVSPDVVETSLAAGVAPERCLLLENGIETEQFTRRQTRSEARQALGLPPEKFILGAVGRLSEEKGFDLLIRSLHQVVAAGLDAHLVIVGEGEEQPALAALARDLGLAERVSLLGYRADPRPVYEALDVYVLSSRREGLPNVLLEAMALEVPVVATRIAGVPRLVRHGENGLVVAPGMVEELTEGVQRLARQPELRQAFARAGRETIETRYSFAARMQKLAELYDDLLSGDRLPKSSRLRKSGANGRAGL
jgi:glycosyltransferase involved in cell wall biosynthesis